MATFDGVTFLERGRGGGTFFPVHGFRQKVAILPIPGGSKVIIQTMGYDAAPLDIPARVTGAQLSSLRTKAKAGTQGTLSYVGGSITATLTSVDGPAEVKSGVDYYFCVLKFLTVAF